MFGLAGEDHKATLAGKARSDPLSSQGFKKCRAAARRWCDGKRTLREGTEVFVCKRQVWKPGLYDETRGRVGRWKPVRPRRALVVLDSSAGEAVVVLTRDGRIEELTRDQVWQPTGRLFEKRGVEWVLVAGDDTYFAAGW